MQQALHWQDATESAKCIREGTVTATALLEHYLQRVHRFNPELHCVVALDEAGARERARQADQALARGESWGPLHGVPMTVKDAFEVVGMPCTSGSASLKDHRPTRNATAVQRLVDAGAIPFGKTNTPEFASDLRTSNTLHGTTGNAWNPARSAGGSSGGSAVALAAGLAALELGSDIGGSSRTPAHFNGVFGMRPTWGLISTIGHIPGPPGALTLDEFNCVGPMARSARDLRLVFDIVRGTEPLFGPSCKLQLPDEPLPAPEQLVLATWLDDSAGPVETRVMRVLAEAVRKIRAAGMATVRETRPPIDARESFLCFNRMIGAITAPRKSEAARDVLRRRVSDPTVCDTLRQHAIGSQMSYADFQKDSQRRNAFRVQWAAFFREHDAVLSPVIGIAAREHGPNFMESVVPIDGQPLSGREHTFWASHQVLANLPSVVVPAGFTEEGLPVGIQVTTGHCEDYKAIALAEALGRILGAADCRPPAWD